MPLDYFPRLKLEIEGLKHSVVHAFSDRSEEIKKYACNVIDASLNHLKEKGLEQVIIKCVDDCLRDAIDCGIRDIVKDEVSEYFRSGKGSELLVNSIREHLNNFS